MAVRAELLGPPHVLVDGERLPLASHRMAGLLCYLGFQGDWARREELIALFWPDVGESRARNRLRQLILATRRKYPFAEIERRGDTLRWRVPTDVGSLTDAMPAAELVDANRGWLLDGFHIDGAPDFEAWVATERSALHERWRAAALQLSTDLARGDRRDDALEILERLERRDPLDEEVAQRQIALLRDRHPERGARRFRSLAEAMDRELGVRPSEETRAIAEGRAVPTVLSTSSPSTGHSDRQAVPVGATEFVGRAAEIAEAEALLVRSECRLLTLCAPGGMGKTRLALELGRRCAVAFSKGAVFVSLVHARTTGAAFASIAEALNVTIYGPMPPHRQIADALGETPTLLILDNLEQLDLAEVLTELLERAPGLTILATSRELLGVQAEWSLALGGLDAPPSALDPDAPAVEPEAWGATRLFVRRARQRRRDLVLDEAQRRAVGRIAVRLGGMPLALELAARWSGVLQPTDIDAELAARAGLEAADDPSQEAGHDAPDRHRSVHFVLEESWRRLGDPERTALRRLSVLHGFTVEAGAAVADAEPGIVRELIGHAFLASVPGTQAPRFEMHPLVRSFCAAKAAEHPDEQAATRDAHARHFLAWAADVNDRILSAEAAELLTRLYEEMDNLRAAWSRAVERGFVDAVGAAIKPLEFAFRSRTWYGAWGELLRHAHGAMEPEGLTHARLAMSIAANHLDLLDAESARRVGERVLPRLDALTTPADARINPHPRAEVRRILGHVAMAHGRPGHAVARFEAARQILLRDGIDPYFAARLADYLGTAHGAAGRLNEGRTWLQRAVRDLRSLAEKGALAVAAGNLARLELQLGAVDHALELAREALRLERGIGRRPRFFVEQLRTASDALRVAERYEEAADLLREELDVLARNPMPVGPRRTLEARDRLGQIAYLQGDLAKSRRYLNGVLTPRACRLALLEGEPRRAARMCADWLDLRSPSAYLTLDLDRLANRAFVLNCAAEASLANGEHPAPMREALMEALRFAAVRSLVPEVLRGAALLAWFHAEHGEPAIGHRLLACVARHAATDPEGRELARSVADRLGQRQLAFEREASAASFEALLRHALAAAGMDVPEPFAA